MSTGKDRGRRIVVGVNGSKSSMAALRWAIGQAEQTGAEVEAVIAWRCPPGNGLAPAPGGAGDPEGDAAKALAGALAEVSGLAPDVIACPRVMQGNAAEVLIRAARGADLLVVGGRGNGRFAAAPGSVGWQCVRHALCPVIVVRSPAMQALR